MKKTIAIITMLAMTAMMASADVITVDNHSFENPTLTDGSHAASVTDWDGTNGTINPTSTMVTESTVDGSNVVYMNPNTWMAQGTGVNFVEGNIYTLTVAVARRLDGAGSVPLQWEIALVKGTDYGSLVQLFGTIGASDPENGVLTDKVLQYTATSDFAGSDIRILLRCTDLDAPQAFFDNVRLDVIPEPATMTLLLLGLPLALRRRRK